MTDMNAQDWDTAHKKYTTFNELTLNSATFAIAFAVITLVTFAFSVFAMVPTVAVIPVFALTVILGAAIVPLRKNTQKAFATRQSIDSKMTREHYGK